MKYYYTLWVDTVTYIRQRQKDDTLIFIPLCLVSVPFICIASAIIFYSLFFFDVKIGLYEYIEQFLLNIGISHSKGVPIIFVSIPFIVNYFLLVKGGKTEKLIEKYPFYNGRFFLISYILSVLAFILPISIMLINRT